MKAGLKIRKNIAFQKITKVFGKLKFYKTKVIFRKLYELWILEYNYWMDGGKWIDEKIWKD